MDIGVVGLLAQMHQAQLKDEAAQSAGRRSTAAARRPARGAGGAGRAVRRGHGPGASGAVAGLVPLPLKPVFRDAAESAFSITLLRRVS